MSATAASSASLASDNELITLAKVGRPYGLQGFIHVYPHSRESDTLLRLKSFSLRTRTAIVKQTAAEVRRHGDAFVMRFEGVSTPEAAATFTNNEIMVGRDAFPTLPEGEFYWLDLIGLTCTDGDKVWGTITEVFESGAHPIMRVLDAETAHEELIPFVDALVRSVSLTDKRVDVAWLGLD